MFLFNEKTSFYFLINIFFLFFDSYLPWFEIYYKLLNTLADYLLKNQVRHPQLIESIWHMNWNFSMYKNIRVCKMVDVFSQTLLRNQTQRKCFLTEVAFHVPNYLFTNTSKIILEPATKVRLQTVLLCTKTKKKKKNVIYNPSRQNCYTWLVALCSVVDI